MLGLTRILEFVGVSWQAGFPSVKTVVEKCYQVILQDLSKALG